MLKHLISLVFLLISFSCLPVFSDTTSVILPKTKPKDLSSIVKEKTSQILPEKKPSVKAKKINKKIFLLPKEKPSRIKSNKVLVKKKLKKPPAKVIEKEKVIEKVKVKNKETKVCIDKGL